MNSRARRGAVLLTVLSALTLAGCSFAVTTDPVRDEETGEILESNASADVFSLTIGDCMLDSDGTGDGITSVPVVPCSEEHAHEAYARHVFTASDFAGDDAVFEEAAFACVDRFEDFVGIAYDESTLEIWPMYPTSESWDAGDREALCFIYDPAGDVEGTLAGAAR